MSELSDLSELRSGATGQPLYRDPAEELAELRRQQRTRGWDDSTPMLRDEAQAYSEIMGPRVKAQEQAVPGTSSFL